MNSSSPVSSPTPPSRRAWGEDLAQPSHQCDGDPLVPQAGGGGHDSHPVDVLTVGVLRQRLVLVPGHGLARGGGAVTDIALASSSSWADGGAQARDGALVPWGHDPRGARQHAPRPRRRHGPAPLARRLPVGRAADARLAPAVPGRGELRGRRRREENGTREELRDELGDLLLQVVFHARVAQEDTEQPFDIDDVAAALVAKLERRHPHVFAGEAVAEDLQAGWDAIKATEKRRNSVLDGIPLQLPALARADKVLGRLQRNGLDASRRPRGGTDRGARRRRAARPRAPRPRCGGGPRGGAARRHAGAGGRRAPGRGRLGPVSDR